MRNALFIFPLAALFNSFSMTGLLLVFGIAGHWETAADIGLVQGATLALFYAFSANARNLILGNNGEAAERRLMQVRLILVLPLAAAACGLSVAIGGVSAVLATVLILRRVSEWIGEIGLAHHERRNQLEFAQQALIVEGLSLAFCTILPLFFGFDLAISAIPWMMAPLLAMRQTKPSLQREGGIQLRALMPHFGATAIIGTSVYVFRVSITLLTGKALAGELFTAFAIGGMIPTIFGQAFAPTLVHRFKMGNWPRHLLAYPALMFLAGITIAALAASESDLLSMIERSHSFGLAVGLSFAGGAIMVVAMALRTRLIHYDDGNEVFGPDLLANVLIATCVPFVFYIFGVQSLAALYLISACLSLGFLWGAGHGRGIRQHQRTSALFIIGVLLALPVFFQIEGGFFTDPATVFDSARYLPNLPIPISAIVVFIGIALLGNYATATRTLQIFFFSVLLFVTTALAVTQGNPQSEEDKLILLAQFLLPMFGLILGEMYGSATNEPIFEWAAFCILTIVLPAQLLATWLQGHMQLQAHVFIFSIYQHLQYFPMIVAALIVMVSFSLWNKARIARYILLGLLPLALIYLAASLSISAFVGGLLGVVCFTVWSWNYSASPRFSALWLALAVLFSSSYLAVSHADLLTFWLNSNDPLSNEEIGKTFMPAGIVGRLDNWYFYVKGLVESPWTFLLGHITPPDHAQYTSAYNYWLDGLYNFGLVAILPLLTLLVTTARLLWQRKKQVVSDTLLFGSSLATAYLLLCENFLTVGMRQPYPGILTFFIWGLLIARLRMASNDFTPAYSRT